MQSIWRSSTITNEVKTKFSITTFHTMIYFTFRHLHFAHDNLEMPYQGFHLCIYILFLRKIIFRNISMEYFSFFTFKLLNLLVSLADNTQRLLHFFVTHQKTVVTIACIASWNDKVKIFITAIRRMDAHIVVYTSSTKVWTGKAIVQSTLSTYW